METFSNPMLVTVGCTFVGGLLKHFFNGSSKFRPNVPNNLIPYIVTILGGVVGSQGTLGIENGALVGLSSVGVHQGVKIALKNVQVTK